MKRKWLCSLLFICLIIPGAGWGARLSARDRLARTLHAGVRAVCLPEIENAAARGIPVLSDLLDRNFRRTLLSDESSLRLARDIIER